ncbi:hypothetical protein ACROYT_G005649 [Oculina patagonica]
MSLMKCRPSDKRKKMAQDLNNQNSMGSRDGAVVGARLPQGPGSFRPGPVGCCRTSETGHQCTDCHGDLHVTCCGRRFRCFLKKYKEHLS